MLSAKTIPIHKQEINISGHNTTATEIISITAVIITAYILLCGVFYLLVKLF